MSLWANAEQLLRDVASAHRNLTRLDAVAPPARARGTAEDRDENLEVPELPATTIVRVRPVGELVFA